MKEVWLSNWTFLITQNRFTTSLVVKDVVVTKAPIEELMKDNLYVKRATRKFLTSYKNYKVVDIQFTKKIS